MIRKGENYSFVELCLYLPENENAIDGNIIVSREIYENGRNLCKINGRMVTVNELKVFMENLIDIHGQHDNQSLLDIQSHLEYLDGFIGEEILNLKTKYKEMYDKYNRVKLELNKNYGDDKEKQRKIDLLRYQVNEIECASLKLGEDEELESKRKIILNSEKISENLKETDIEINENAIDSISNSIRLLEKIEDLDKKYSDILNNLKSIYYDLEETARDISTLNEDTYFDEEERNNIEKRLDLIFSLKRKYGNTIEEILSYKEEISKEIYEIENLDEYINRLKEEINNLEKGMTDICLKMNKLRKTYASKLEEEINKELKDLEMKNARFKIRIQYNTENKFNKDGLDEIEFMISTNIGEEEKSLIKIASGGEISRIMLAIKTVLSNVDKIPVLIFDEIDTGISGIAAKSVSKKLKSIAKTHQVLCVTHLATIAAKGDYNYYINKDVIDNKTKTNIRMLNEEEVIYEVARISSGEITQIALNHARELRKD